MTRPTNLAPRGADVIAVAEKQNKRTREAGTRVGDEPPPRPTAQLNTPEQHTLVRSTCAKDGISKAQDAAALIRNKVLRRRVERELWAARSRLEAVDRVLRDAMKFVR